MKKIISITLAVLLLVCTALTLISCNSVDAEGLWENATHRRDKTFGSGDKTFSVTVTAGESSVVFTVRTDKDNLADALLKHELIDGEEGDFGFTVYSVNGMTADFTVDKAYWAIYVGDKYASTGASGIKIADGASYSFVYEVYSAY
ncbi:MAG: DUF4430 domain-containing protein [Clostridia bacterium]|nr:DUF4430 domain-containing protein [Clostridia bacterium]